MFHKAIPGPSSCLINCMVELAGIVREISSSNRMFKDSFAIGDRSTSCAELDARLVDWKSRLPPQLNLDTVSLDETELVTKQKVVLKLRRLTIRVPCPVMIFTDKLGSGFWNARILLHRPFLIVTAATNSDRETISIHIISCVEAAQESIRFMHNTYLLRPYFRTWYLPYILLCYIP